MAAWIRRGCLPAMLLGCLAGSAQAQASTFPIRWEGVAWVEAIGAGGRAIFAVHPSLALGAGLNVGRFEGIDLRTGVADQLHVIGAIHLTGVARIAGPVRLVVSPIGTSLVTGDDFGALYPSAEAGLEFARARLRASSAVRVVRIPTGDAGAEYWVQWVPLRVGIAFPH